VENLVAEKNDLSFSFLHHSLLSDQDDRSKVLLNQDFMVMEKAVKFITFI